MTKRELDDLRELHMEFASLAHLTGTMKSNSITDFFGWIYKQLGTRADAEMTGFGKGKRYAEEKIRNTKIRPEFRCDTGCFDERSDNKVSWEILHSGTVIPTKTRSGTVQVDSVVQGNDRDTKMGSGASNIL
jgi:hypothetical protein